jgi:hypothetical protein
MANKRSTKRKKIMLFIGAFVFVTVGSLAFIINRLSSMGAENVLIELKDE